MLPEPLHPAVVHFPLALAILLPFFAAAGIWFSRGRTVSRRAWLAPLVLAVALTGSAWVALRTGESEEDRVEAVVPESAIHNHEEAAERFLVLAAVLALLAGAGMVTGTIGQAARLLTLAGSVVVAVSAVQVGDAGGDLVYEHNAASAYTNTNASAITVSDDDD